MPHLLLWLVSLLTTTYSSQFNTSLRNLGLNKDSHFNAAYGSRIEVSPAESASCEQGTHCVTPWWFHDVSGSSNSTEDFDSLATRNRLNSRCSRLEVKCNHTCPSLQYSTPEPQSIAFDTVQCHTDGSRYFTATKDMKYPLLISTNDSCSSFTFISEFSRAAGWNFIFELDLHHMRKLNIGQLLLLEGKLVSKQGARSTDETFLWTVDQKEGQLYLSLKWLMFEQFNTAPQTLYRSEETLVGDSVTVHLFLKHVTKAPGSTCFYVNGVRAACLPNISLYDKAIAFVSLNGQNNFGLRTISGSIRDIQLYRMGLSSAIISEREIQTVYLRSIGATLSDSNYVDCLCQHVDYPSMERAEWLDFGAHSNAYTNYCYRDISNRTNRIPRVNEHEHRVYNVIDNDLHTMWMSMTGLDNINITFTFPRQVIIKGLILALSALPSSIKVWRVSGGRLLGQISLSCGAGAMNCVTWGDITSTALPPGLLSLPEFPTLEWMLSQPTQADKIVLQFQGYQSSNVFLINEILVAATCLCSPESTCKVNHQATASTAFSNHKCICPDRLSGTYCNECADGYFTPAATGSLLRSNMCEPCTCDSKGTCQISANGCEPKTVSLCNSKGQCLCRFGNSSKIDRSNYKCEAVLRSITPEYGPASGGTEVTITGSYIIAYNTVIMTSTTHPAKVYTRKATPNKSTTDGLEQIVFVTPVSQGTEDKFTIRLAGGVPENSTLLMFSYRPDPVVTFVRPRNINVEGGLEVKVQGDNFDSVAHICLLTHLHCLASGKYYKTISSSCQGNETFLSCVTPELTEELPSIECVRTQRLRRRTDNVLRTDYSEIYAVLGLQFDGLQDYQRLNTSFKTKIFPNPAIRRLTKAERSLTEDEILLEIFGYGLVDCCRADDYSVTVGNEECVIENLTNSRIICKLPESFHSAEHNSTFSLTIFLGENTTLYSDVITKQKVGSIWEDKELVTTLSVSITVTIAVTIIITITVICVYHTQSSTEKVFEAVEAKQVYQIKEKQRSDNLPATSSHFPAHLAGLTVKVNHQKEPIITRQQDLLSRPQTLPPRSRQSYQRSHRQRYYPGMDNIQYVDVDDIQYVDKGENIQYMDPLHDIPYYNTTDNVNYVYADTAGNILEDLQYADTATDIQYMDRVGDIQYADTTDDIQYMNTAKDAYYLNTNEHVGRYADTVDGNPYVDTTFNRNTINTIDDVHYTGNIGDVQYAHTMGNIQYLGVQRNGLYRYAKNTGRSPYEYDTDLSDYDEELMRLNSMSCVEYI
ncbi:hypothetical protein EB796_016773 [Bugula neritina]|uniref:Laminin EGF-like domain-containing protein n=1 Tax=Bugula neritina TaxID=10212 RepID=A0A7J7JH78_BUGNE|nr:hypothetical protein EB796_016773 [Bugula neritina]